MREYEKPTIEIIELKHEHVITTSGSTKLDVSDTPGGGIVDKDFSEIF